MRIFISADIEGVAGVVHLPTTGPWRYEWAQGRAWMTDEVLAAMDGARAAGATSFIVSDGHGSAHNLLVDRFGDDVEIVRSWPRPLLQMDGIERNCDACVFIGHHAMAQSAFGVLSHTYTLTFRAIRLNGVAQSETSLNALLAAHYGVPTVFASGDDDYLAHIADILPGIATVETQRALGYTAADCLTPTVSCARIREGVRDGMARRGDIAVMAQPQEFALEIEFATRSQPEMLDYLPWFERIDAHSIAIRATDAPSLMRMLAFLAFYQSAGAVEYGQRKIG
ncbi:MAG: M55 family metallopeptidase [Sphingomonas sp.]